MSSIIETTSWKTYNSDDADDWGKSLASYGLSDWEKQPEALDLDDSGNFSTTTYGYYYNNKESFTSSEVIALQEFNIGSYIYPFKTKLELVYWCENQVPDRWYCKDREGWFSDYIIGSGNSLASALANWKQKFHDEFQRLFGLRPFELPVEDRNRLKTFKKYIDLRSHRDRTPMTIRRYGTILETANGRPTRIEWESGQIDVIAPDSAPIDFLNYKQGQKFCAVSEVDFNTYDLRKILNSSPIF